MSLVSDRLIETYNANVYFVSTDYGFSSEDNEVHREIVTKMRFASCARCIEEEYSDSTLKGLIGLADVAIGTRYHFAIFACSQRVPFLGIASGTYQQTKLKGLADLCDLPQCFINEDMEFTDINSVWPQVANLVEQRDTIRAALEINVPELETRSQTGVREVARLLTDPHSSESAYSGTQLLHG